MPQKLSLVRQAEQEESAELHVSTTMNESQDLVAALLHMVATMLAVVVVFT